jgi:hypothetical protein
VESESLDAECQYGAGDGEYYFYRRFNRAAFDGECRCDGDWWRGYDYEDGYGAGLGQLGDGGRQIALTARPPFGQCAI